ncbi:DNA repair helicase RAD25 [Metallosphaera sedula]|uniref:DNA repair helicase RAD25 n=3 Tax=Metallosphaera TaxID=41980 RepID=A4YEA6_METS5|nr:MULTISPECIES: DEAD/DEAH box helicase family protein [Metallosphaera]ABP94758.1 DNA repair helicase RAD25 [Metallosphaera sedula DSM 5348]AIM26745.1 DNA repair helicase RAD25 [Metallosphaera sedula]AKV73700.1 helicase [Metallosphaera sedula]AKV75940.1 helicase [Metallosphaera sedula]AKV78191.1 helicase [Metallosphaera sedula]
MVHLKYFRGLLISDHYAPSLSWNEEFKAYIAPAYRYYQVLEYFRQGGIEVKDEVMDPIPFPLVKDSLKLRDYQERAMKAWMAKKRGVLVLPTGAGKTALGIKAIANLRVATLVVVPTIELLHQWGDRIRESLGVEPGIVGGGEENIQGITVITYDSAYTKVEKLGNRFPLVIFDEVHHLPSTGYINIGELMASPYRMGLTATPEREDGRHVLLREVVGPILIRLSPSQLAGKYLAEFKVEKIYVELTPEEREIYEKLRNRFTSFLRKRKIRMAGPRDFQRFIFMAGRDKEAREALLAWNESLRLAVNSESKLIKLREILKERANEKIIIFTRDVDMAYRVSREFLVPAVTYLTSKDERQDILSKFKNGDYKVIVASNVFDEGVDVPDASVGIVLGGYGTSRQMMQRLGRILRKKEGKVATLIEIVTKGTTDHNLSRRRSSATK